MAGIFFMNDKEKLIERFYQSFSKRDYEGMQACYHKAVVFEDPAFGILKGEAAGAMWKMLCLSAKDLSISFRDIHAKGSSVQAVWEAKYTFKKTGRPVHNIIKAEFTFEDGLIIFHKDSFPLRKWAGQALGWKGYLLGGTAMFKTKLQAQTKGMLDKFMEAERGKP
ncbi:nuclear transport factor 2 family protein [Pararhodonellum marinum]|uniref:nuclear transport factor 2 family protein n=1 Tax=Pararhodonellum marinum TaxID=2755358 RepID=UPI001E44A210|nr:nuclear transport factor 2 family protein [Pararhodonellum marinum]